MFCVFLSFLTLIYYKKYLKTFTKHQQNYKRLFKMAINQIASLKKYFDILSVTFVLPSNFINYFFHYKFVYGTQGSLENAENV